MRIKRFLCLVMPAVALLALMAPVGAEEKPKIKRQPCKHIHVPFWKVVQSGCYECCNKYGWVNWGPNFITRRCRCGPAR